MGGVAGIAGKGRKRSKLHTLISTVAIVFRHETHAIMRAHRWLFVDCLVTSNCSNSGLRRAQKNNKKCFCGTDVMGCSLADGAPEQLFALGSLYVGTGGII